STARTDSARESVPGKEAKAKNRRRRAGSRLPRSPWLGQPCAGQCAIAAMRACRSRSESGRAVRADDGEATGATPKAHLARLLSRAAAYPQQAEYTPVRRRRCHITQRSEGRLDQPQHFLVLAPGHLSILTDRMGVDGPSKPIERREIDLK